MHPICFHLGPLTIHWFGVLMALGFAAGLANWTWLGRRRGWDFNFASDLLFWVMVSGVVGARAAHVLSDPAYFAANPARIVRLDQGGLVFYGGVVGSFVALMVFARSRRVGLAGLLDFVATSLPLGHAFGRIGCFLNGCCHGRTAPAWMGVSYPARGHPWDQQVAAGLIAPTAGQTLPVHAVQLYEAAFNVALYAILVRLFRRGAPAGRVTAVYLMAYAAGRFALEFLRADHGPPVLGLTLAQLFGIPVFAAGLCVWLGSRSGRFGAGNAPGEPRACA